MSATREQWAAILMRVAQVIYQRQAARFGSLTPNQATLHILQDMNDWTLGELNHFILENFSHEDKELKNHGAVFSHCSTACTSLQ